MKTLAFKKNVQLKNEFIELKKHALGKAAGLFHAQQYFFGKCHRSAFFQSKVIRFFLDFLRIVILLRVFDKLKILSTYLLSFEVNKKILAIWFFPF